MMDWLSSKMVLGIASLLLIASIAGAFGYIKDRNIENELDTALLNFSDLLWELNSSDIGTEVEIEPGEGVLITDILGEDVHIYIYNGMLQGDVKDISSYVKVPRVLSAQELPLRIDSPIRFEKVQGGLFVTRS